jgi:hypothetical protein
VKPKEKGDIAVAYAISYFMTHDCEVCLPIGDKKPYDLIIEKNNKLYKVQVKYAGTWGKDGKCMAALRTMGGNQSYHTAKRYSKADFDLLFVHSAKNQDFLIPWSDIDNVNSISVECGKYSKYAV